jgi:hypothetical protein
MVWFNKHRQGAGLRVLLKQSTNASSLMMVVKPNNLGEFLM